jgi:predicted house-cleaning noncanonical NTP pyrophosphatase (MazG superfamily)
MNSPTSLAEQIKDLAQELRTLQESVSKLQSDLAQRPPVHVEHLDVGSVEFRLDSLDINDLGGELNIGFTNMVKSGGGSSGGGKKSQSKKQPLKEQITKLVRDKLKPLLQQQIKEALSHRSSSKAGSSGSKNLEESVSARLEKALEERLEPHIVQALADLVEKAAIQQVEKATGSTMDAGRKSEIRSKVAKALQAVLEGKSPGPSEELLEWLGDEITSALANRLSKDIREVVEHLTQNLGQERAKPDLGSKQSTPAEKSGGTSESGTVPDARPGGRSLPGSVISRWRELKTPSDQQPDQVAPSETEPKEGQ